MWLYFDRNGTLIQQFQYYGPALRTGATDGEIFAVFEDMDEATLADITATLKLLKPVSGRDAGVYAYYPITMDLVTETFDTSNFDTIPDNISPFVNGRSYPGFRFSFNQTFDDDTLVLLDTPGIWSAIISLFKSDGSISVQGRANFNVQNNGYSQDETNLPEDWSLDQIYTAIAAKLSIKSGGYIKLINIADVGDFVMNENRFNQGDTLYNEADKSLYIINSSNELVLIGSITKKGKTNKDFIKIRRKEGLEFINTSSSPVRMIEGMGRRKKGNWMSRSNRWGSKYCNLAYLGRLMPARLTVEDFLSLLFINEGYEEAVEWVSPEGGNNDLFPNDHVFSNNVLQLKVNDSTVIDYTIINNIFSVPYMRFGKQSKTLEKVYDYQYASSRTIVKFIENLESKPYRNRPFDSGWNGNMARIWAEVQFTVKITERTVHESETESGKCEVYAYVKPHRFD